MEFFSKSRVKYIQSLQHKKFRLKYDKFIVEGLKITEELLRDAPSLVDEILVTNPVTAGNLEEIWPGGRILHVMEREMEAMSQLATPPGILAVCRLPQPDPMPADVSDLRVFYLDGIRDPGNLGTILRIADWFGLDFVIRSPDCVDVFNQKVLQASMGSAFRVPTNELPQSSLLELTGVRAYVCDGTGTSIAGLAPPAGGVLILGNESLGVSEFFAQHIHEALAVPAHRSRGAESLNVATAAAILAAWWTHSV